MTPLELAQVQKMIEGVFDRKIAIVIQPLQEQIDALKLVDKSHSFTHRDLAANVKLAKSEVEHKVVDTATALAVRDRAIVEAISGVETRLVERFASVETQSIRPGTMAAVAAKDATTAIAVEQVQAKAAMRQGLTESRLRTLAAFVALVIVALLNHFAKG